MKIMKTITAIALLLIIPSNVHATTETQSKIQIIDSSNLSGEILRNRNGNIIIEECIGVVTNAEGDGKILNCYDSEYNYISYKGIDKANVGDKILTYLIYNPETDYIDDIIYRFDYIIQ